MAGFSFKRLVLCLWPVLLFAKPAIISLITAFEHSSMHTDQRIDAYIARSAPFAQPILEHLRRLVHAHVPGVQETMKWSFPHFMYHGEILCSMAAFKAHCAFGFWKGQLIKIGEGLFSDSGNGMGDLGKIKSINDLPNEGTFRIAFQEAMFLNESGQKVARVPKAPTPKTVAMPPDFKDLLQRHPQAALVYENFSASQQKEYLLWIEEAKTEPTRKKRMDISIEWLTEGKIRNWKYVR